jgi:hypothetical protein
MKDEIYCFTIFTIDKYGIFCIIIRRDFAFHEFISFLMKYLLSFRTKGIVQGQTIHFISE